MLGGLKFLPASALLSAGVWPPYVTSNHFKAIKVMGRCLLFSE